ncbi:uncharacterized protein [Populus alba]|uniref:uncharacterized protein n=1 Tax=Populus alba TaxID=43335 RepID=UPI003CC74EDD
MVPALKMLKDRCRQWSKASVGTMNTRIEELELEADSMDCQNECRVLTADELIRTATTRQKKNQLACLEVDRQILSKPIDMKLAVFHFFRNLYSHQNRPRASCSNLEFLRLKPSSSAALELPFSVEEITAAVWDCDGNKAPGPDGINSTFVTLIPKIKGANKLLDFRPISLLGSLYKIFSKILANRLKHVMPEMARVDYAMHIMAKMFVLVNGSPTEEFYLAKGLRQGDPLSPFLFNIAVQGLSCMLQRGCDLGLTSGINIGNTWLVISHLQFADDTLMFSSDSLHSMQKIKPSQMQAGSIASHVSWAPYRWKLGQSYIVESYFAQYQLSIGFMERQKLRSFLWSGNAERHKICNVSWATVTLPKHAGGLGIGSLKDKNTALLFKWLWRFGLEESSLWKDDIVNEQSLVLIGNGKKTMFWLDCWLNNHCLAEHFPTLFQLSNDKAASIAKMGMWEGLQMDKHGEDRLIWKDNNFGRFSVKSLCGLLSPKPSTNNAFSFAGIWKGIVPPKVEIFCWMTIINRINTRLVGFSLVLPKELLRYVVSMDFHGAWSFSEEGMVDVVLLSGMLKAIHSDFPYSPTDLIRSVDGLLRWSNAHSFRIINKWSPLMINSLKWNVDDSSLGKPGLSGIGDVLQNHHGHLLGMFYVRVGILDSNIAELRAIVKAIELSASNCLLHHQHLIIESDFVNVIKWMNKPHSRPWKHHNLFSFVNKLKAYFGSITFSHIFHESNCMADCMAKQGVRRSSEFVA